MTKRARILVIDDEFDIADLLAELLMLHGYEADTAINGQAALGQLRTGSFDLVITDFMMPIMDGLELVKSMRREKQLERTPVIMMSAQADAVRQQSNGLVQAIVQKPLKTAPLLELIDRIMAEVR